MTKPPTHEVTQLLQAWSDGNAEALDQLAVSDVTLMNGNAAPQDVMAVWLAAGPEAA